MGHVTRRIVILVTLLTLPLVAAEGDDAPPKSSKAKAALKKYDRAVEKAKADYDRAVAAAGKELRGELDVSLKAAMKAGTLDEAKRIEAAMPAGAGPLTVRADAITVTRAVYGVGDSTVDLTPMFQRLVKQSGRIQGLPAAFAQAKPTDPAPGRHKTLRIAGRYGGKPFMIAVSDAGVWNLEFGAPNEN